MKRHSLPPKRQKPNRYPRIAEDSFELASWAVVFLLVWIICALWAVRNNSFTEVPGSKREVGSIVKSPRLEYSVHPATCAKASASEAISTNYSTSGKQMFLYLPPIQTNLLYIRCGSDQIVIDMNSGHVTLPPAISNDLAAIAFWKAVQKHFPPNGGVSSTTEGRGPGRSGEGWELSREDQTQQLPSHSRYQARPAQSFPNGGVASNGGEVGENHVPNREPNLSAVQSRPSVGSLHIQGKDGDIINSPYYQRDVRNGTALEGQIYAKP